METEHVELFIRCPRCERPDLRAKDFGVCRARPSGRNLYCALCSRQKVALGRQRLREYKHAQASAGQVVREIKPAFSPRRAARILRKLQPADRVREAIRAGGRTQKEIARVTKLPKDEVCDALAQLLLWSRAIRTEVVNHTRMYFVNETAEAATPPRKPMAMSFSSVTALMPGARQRTEKKISAAMPDRKRKSA